MTSLAGVTRTWDNRTRVSSDSIELAQVFLQSLSAPSDGKVSEAALGATLRWIIVSAHAAWPDVRVDDLAFIRYLAARTQATTDVLDELASLDAGGLYLACACRSGDAHAIERFMSTMGPHVDRALANMRVGTPEREDVLSRLQQICFFGGGPGAAPIVGTYTGRGSLRNWARSVGVKQALAIRHKDRKLVALDEESLERCADPADPEVAYLRDFYLEEFQAALGRAVRAVPRRERNLLRQHYLDGMSLEAVARVHRVHRATAARWLADAREQVLRGTREELGDALRLSPSELESVLAFVRRQSSFGANMVHVRGVLEGK